MATRQSYDQELESLRLEILEMGKLVQQAIHTAVEALAQQNVQLAGQVLDGDDAIDEMEIVIEDKCMLLIAKQQPLAKDLRIIGTGLKITTDLERVGDHAFDVAKIALKLANEPLIKPLIDIPRMAALAENMLKESLEAYVNLDIAQAKKVCVDDDDVDDICNQVFRELLTYMMENPHTITQATQLIFVTRYLERVADHSTNIAEWVIYLATGQRLRKK